MKKALLIVNPVSGKKKIEKYLDEIKDLIVKSGSELEIVHTAYRGHATELAKSAKENGFDSVICCGGDGTLNETVSGLIKSGTNTDVKIGYIPCGSTNDFADTLGLSTNPIKQTQSILKDNTRKMDIGSFNGTRNFTYIASIGALTESSYSAPQKLKNVVGHFAYVLEGIKDIKNIKPIEAEITSDNKLYCGKYAFASVSNTKSVAGIVKLSDDIVNLADGKFEVILVKYPKNLIETIKILHGAMHSNFKSDLFDFFRTDNIDFKFKTQIAWTLDGEKEVSGTEVNIRALKNAIDLYK